MTIAQIRSTPTSLSREYLQDPCHDAKAFHESLLRSFHVVEKVKTMLRRGDSQATILEVIEEIERREVS